MVGEDGVSFEDVVAVCCIEIYVLVELAGVERGVVEVANVEENCMLSRWL